MPERYAVWLDRDVIEVTGPESGSFLQGQLSQDVERLAVGTSGWSWVLAPTGKVDALVRVTRVADDRWLLDTDGGWGEALLTRLNRFKLRTKADLASLPWQVLGRRGEGAALGAADGSGAEVSWSTPGPGWRGWTCSGPRRWFRPAWWCSTPPVARRPGSPPVSRRWGPSSPTRPSRPKPASWT